MHVNTHGVNASCYNYGEGLVNCGRSMSKSSLLRHCHSASVQSAHSVQHRKKWFSCIEVCEFVANVRFMPDICHNRENHTQFFLQCAMYAKETAGEIGTIILCAQHVQQHSTY